MMLSELTAVLLGLFLFSTAVEANTGESLQVKLYNLDLHVSASQIQKMLKKANLEGHDYQKEVTITRVKKPGEPENRQKSYYYYKIVDCSKVPVIEQELNDLLSDAFGSELADKLTSEMGVRHLGDTGKCKTGMQIVYNYGNKKAKLSDKKRFFFPFISISLQFSLNIGIF